MSIDANSPKAGGMCDVFASSCDTRPNPITQRLLRKLLKRYRNGKIWFFDEAERIEQVSEKTPPQPRDTALSSGSDTVKKSRRDDHRREILKLFPRARCVCFVGMWDHSQQRWYAAGFSWTYSPLTPGHSQNFSTPAKLRSSLVVSRTPICLVHISRASIRR